jgi:hypothetical protein
VLGIGTGGHSVLGPLEALGGDQHIG